MSGRLLFLVLLAVALAACQTRDEIKPGYLSGAGDDGVAVMTTSATAKPKPSQQKESRYFIEFRSRYALTYGHSYVVFGRLDQKGQMIDPEVAGLAPASKSAVPYVLGHYVPVPSETGWSDGDLEDKYRSASWRVMLSEAEYRKVVAYIRKLKASSPVWHAALYNCNAFVADIARSMGYKAPGIWLRPQQFIVKLRQMNGGPNPIGYTGPPG
ncbi:hypothetical protein [Phyllobacterium zundukense]|uniref:Lipoprotein n=1 Tax=Phyllobacterium zundukense TaxID=1867719 RepID=A0A2N9W426_9HYPH|nr:hypothetical protein [Phyllobacterium zundukense]ATU92035.1 hypothetical protein BLM14_10635 [Phyllobacterium zundukense]PIO46494.1 hypothetical protein B5P45_01440 [Phyllobacterium zundukense]